MDHPTILVADGDPKNLQILRESLEGSDFEVISAQDGLQAWQKISSDVPDLILSEVNLPKLDGFQLLEKLKADPATSSIPIMFLTNRRDLQDRVRSLRGGVKDYMIKPLHVKEVLARIRMILRRMERIRDDESESTPKLAGRLEEFNPVDLIQNFGVERKTGVLTLNNENNRNGEIYFRDGAVINASLGNIKSEKAVYQMLPWKRGHFTMMFKEIDVPDEISVSNLGLLLQGYRRMEDRERLFKELSSPETVFEITEQFRQALQGAQVASDAAKFISLIDGRRDILQIIDESIYDDINTLERLVKLFKQGFIKPNKATLVSSEDETDLTSTIAEPKFLEKYSTNSLPTAVAEPPRSSQPETDSQDKMPPQSDESRQDFMQGLIKQDDNDQDAVEKPTEPAELENRIDSQDSSNEKTDEAKPFEPDDDITDRLWPDRESTPQERSESDNGVDEPTIEIREEGNKSDSDGLDTTEMDQIMQGVWQGMSPATETADLKPLDFNDIVDQPEKREDYSDAKPPTEITEDAREDSSDRFEIDPSFEEAHPQQPTEPKSALDELQTAELLFGDSDNVQQPEETPEADSPPTHSEPLTEAEASKPEEEIIQSEQKAPDTFDKSLDVLTSLTKLAESSATQQPKFVVIGRNSDHITATIKHILGPETSTRKMKSNVFQHLEIGERQLNSNLRLSIIGISIEQQFTQFMKNMAQDLIGFALLIEANRQDDLSYLGYLLTNLKKEYRVPFGIAAIKIDGQKNFSTDMIRDLLHTDPDDFVQNYDSAHSSSAVEFFNGLASEANIAHCIPQENDEDRSSR